jgi:hypothetical protein
MRNYSTAEKFASAGDFPPDESVFHDYDREIRKLDDIAFTFLTATAGDNVEAENLLDNFISLLFEDGVLSTWRYRLVLAAIRAGL